MEQSPFTVNDSLRDLFGSHAGSRLRDQITYVPTGTIEEFHGYHYGRYLRMTGYRTFPAADWADMYTWMQQYDNSGLTCFNI